MTVNTFALGFAGGRVTGYINHNGYSALKNEFRGAEYSVKKKGSNLEAIVETANLGKFDIKMIFDNRRQLDLDEVNYDPKIYFWPTMDIYMNSSQIIPAVSASPFSYKITVKNKDVGVCISVNQGFINGSAQLDMGPDNNGIYQMKQVTFYDGSGRLIYGFVPPARKPRSKDFASVPSGTGTSSGKSSP